MYPFWLQLILMKFRAYLIATNKLENCTISKFTDFILEMFILVALFYLYPTKLFYGMAYYWWNGWLSEATRDLVYQNIWDYSELSSFFPP